MSAQPIAYSEERPCPPATPSETVTRVADTAVPDADSQAASAVFSEKELVDLTIAIGLMNAYNRLAIGFWVPPKAAPSERLD